MENIAWPVFVNITNVENITLISEHEICFTMISGQKIIWRQATISLFVITLGVMEYIDLSKIFSELKRTHESLEIEY